MASEILANLRSEINICQYRPDSLIFDGRPNLEDDLAISYIFYLPKKFTNFLQNQNHLCKNYPCFLKIISRFVLIYVKC